jgi:hypothetical protein
MDEMPRRALSAPQCSGAGTTVFASETSRRRNIGVMDRA